MRLVSFSIKDYRSITKAKNMAIGQSTILIGPNNEGKSNILRGMVAALNLLAAPDPRADRFGRRSYEWERDFPIALQAAKPLGESVFTLEFELNKADVDDFWTEVRSDINGTLPVQISVGAKGSTFKVMKKGPGGPALSKKRELIAKYIAKRIDIQYIPAVRTAESALESVDLLLGREFVKFEANAEYKAAVEALNRVQKPMLDDLSQSVKKTLSAFLPDVKEVKIQISKNERYRALRRSTEVLIDDGTQTHLHHKGDGVQSLAALALMRHLSESGSLGKNILIAIEEPEAHLHPKAIHQVRSVLKELAAKHRLVIATHCPLFVDRSDIANNILVQGNRARPATSIDDVREVLGVRASDNLRHAELVLLVEGRDDKTALDALLRANSPILAGALTQGSLVVEDVGGGTNVPYKAGLVRDALCELHLFLDGDEAGKKGAELVRAQGIAVDSEINFVTCPGMMESEIEDLYSVDAYKEVALRQFGVRLEGNVLKGNKKWSVRMREAMARMGKVWDDSFAMRFKAAVADAVAASPESALEKGRRAAFDALVSRLEERVAHGVAAQPPQPIR